MTKAELRKQIKIVLSENKSSFKFCSNQICNKILQSSEYKTADIILSYMALPDEVDLSAVFFTAVKDFKKIFLPRIIPGTSLMDFYQAQSPAVLAAGSFNISEPAPNPKFLFSFDTLLLQKPYKKILILVPGRAFTADGLRLGRGKGFYDIFLSKIPAELRRNVTVSGVCFPFQIVQSLPFDSHDIRMDKIFC